jgi:hypothetical protein
MLIPHGTDVIYGNGVIYGLTSVVAGRMVIADRVVMLRPILAGHGEADAWAVTS